MQFLSDEFSIEKDFGLFSSMIYLYSSSLYNLSSELLIVSFFALLFGVVAATDTLFEL